MTYLPDTLPQKSNFVILYQVDTTIDRNDIVKALAQSGINDQSEYEIISFTPSIGKRPNSDREWMLVCNEAVGWFQELKNKLASYPNQPTFHVFSAAPIPLVIHFGALLSAWKKIVPYQYDKDEKTWRPWDEEASKDGFFDVTSRPRNESGQKLLVFISVARSIEEQAKNTKLYKENKENVLSLTAKSVSQGAVFSASAAVKAAQEIKDELDGVFNKLKCVKSIHIFFAGPVALGFKIGELINPNVFPNTVLYNYFPQKNPSYRAVCEFNASALSKEKGSYLANDRHPLKTIVYMVVGIALFIVVLGLGYKFLIYCCGKMAGLIFFWSVLIVLVVFGLVKKDTLERFIDKYIVRD